MILLYNIYITETNPTINNIPLNCQKFRGNLNSRSNFDIFKYSIASVSKIYSWKKAIIYIKLDEIYNHRKDELEQFLKKEFEHTELVLRWTRNERQVDWIETYELLNDRLIWFCCNHDHIFLDTDLLYFNNIINKLYNEEEYCSLEFSHFPENIRVAKLYKDYKFEHDLWISRRLPICDSIQIITKELYHNWWLTGNFNEYLLPRPDYFGKAISEIKQIPEQKIISPLKEWCRHFDGYNHVNISNDKCPSLDIPTGFFENNINISYGERITDYVNFNPINEKYYISDINGTDYQWLPSDIPLFWRSRIKNVVMNNKYDDETNIQYRIKSILNMICYNGFPVDTTVIDKIVNLYATQYGFQL